MNTALRISEARQILLSLGLPQKQQNERSALCLLALLDMAPDKTWPEAKDPRLGITPMMDWVSTNYGKQYAPNSRETFRKETIHQFVEAGIALINPDKPTRSTNSPKYYYQIEPNALDLLRTFGTPTWEINLQAYLNIRESLITKYAMQRDLNLVPVTLADGLKITLSPGEHSELIKAIIDEFTPRFAPGSRLVYVGDTGEKWGYHDKELLAQLNIAVNLHGKMPDVVLYFPIKNWLLLVESVTSHGPVNSKRHNELAKLFSTATAGLVYVTAFPTRSLMARYLSEIAWETEVWVAEAPSHLIHFNGERFLGPYSKPPA